MNIVLLSGGSGRRLWPLSNEMQSKQFLKLLKNERGEYESMVQRVMRQQKAANPDASIFVSCNTAQNDTLQRQLGTVETILEPESRDTFPAISLAAAYLHFEKKLDENEVFVVCPIDVFADKEYFELLAKVEELVISGGCEIGLMGAVPTFPTEKYGYILQGSGKVSGFTEKPTENVAKKLIEDGALWNCGVFAQKIGYALRHARRYADFDSFGSLFDKYAELPRISFDYEVVEKEPSVGVVTYSGVWKDLGTWNTLTEEMTDFSHGSNVLISDSCENTNVLNMLNIPVIAQDIHDAVVVASHDGILVSSKPGSSYLKPLAEQINLRPMYEQREWGNYRVLDYKKSDGGVSSLIKRMHIDTGKSISYQSHGMHSKTWVIVSGKGIVTIDSDDSVVSPGSEITIAKDSQHSILAATDMELIEVQVGEGDIEES